MFEERPATKKSLSCRKPVYGVGVNDADYITHRKVSGRCLFCPYYKCWVNMLKRCYCDKHQQRAPTYKGCSVFEEWKTFTNFKAWMESQDWEGNHLDKDLLFSGNKIYSPDTCLFVPAKINTLLTDCGRSRGKLPIGVSKHRKRYRAQCNANGKHTYIGAFDSPDIASEAYLNFKSKEVAVTAHKYNRRNPLHSALMRISTEISEGEYYS